MCSSFCHKPRSSKSREILALCSIFSFSALVNVWPGTPCLHYAKSRHRLRLGRHRFQIYGKCKQVQVDLGRLKKVELFEKNKLLFTNLFLKISRIIVINLHFFCSVNRSRNRIHVHQAWRAIFYWLMISSWIRIQNWPCKCKQLIVN